MAFLRSSRVRDAFELTAAATVEVAPDSPMGAVGLNGDGTLYMIEELYVTRPVADAVPAYRRAKRIVSSTLAQLSLVQHDAAGTRLPSIPFLRTPDPTRVTSAVLADTFDDLADHAVAYWYNPAWSTPAGWRYADAGGERRKHKEIRVLPFDDVLDVTSTAYRIRFDGREDVVPASAVIGFECKAGGWLTAGARAITTARLLEDSARLYAKTPQPTTVVKNNGPRKTAEQVQELLSSLEASRRDRSTAYVGRDLDLDSFGFDAQQIALAEARAQAILDIARLTGVPAPYLSQGVTDTSMTYSNTTQQRLDLHASMLPFAVAVEERLSMDDVTGQGVRVTFDFAPFLRADPKLRAELAAIYVPLEVYTIDEARQLEGFITSEGSTV